MNLRNLLRKDEPYKPVFRRKMTPEDATSENLGKQVWYIADGEERTLHSGYIAGFDAPATVIVAGSSFGPDRVEYIVNCYIETGPER